MIQVQELRAVVCEKTETIDTLKQELKDLSVSSAAEIPHFTDSSRV